MSEEVEFSSAATAPSVLIAACTLNEVENVGPFVGELRRALPHADVLIVDDRSPDGTAGVVESLAERDPAVRCDVRDERGLGGAIRHAMMAATEGGYDFLINLDADFSHDPGRVGDLLRPLVDNDDLDVVVGSRYVDGGRIEGWPTHRRLMSATLNRFAARFLGLPVTDCSGSMRCYRVVALRRIDLLGLQNRGYAILEEILVQLSAAGAKMVEVPITFRERRAGVSKLTFREAIRSMSQIIRLAVRRTQSSS